MSTTTLGDLLARADQLARALAASHAPVSASQWACLDVTLHQLLVTIDRATASRSRAAASALPSARIGGMAASAGYPEPLRSPVGKTTNTVTDAARLLHVAPRTIKSRVREGLLTAHRDGRLVQIDADSLHPQRVPLADSADAHPFARLTVTLGALNDLLASTTARHSGVNGPALNEPTAATVTAHVLSVASVAARHTLQYGPIADAMRPLLIAQYADRRHDALSHHGAHASIPLVAVTVPTNPPSTWTERLEAAADAWATAARTDLSLTVPSIEVIRNVTNQAAHAHAATAIILTAVAPALGPPVDAASDGIGPVSIERTTSILGDSIRALREADQALGPATK